MTPRPPRLAEAVLRSLLPEVCRDEALDDLFDLYARRCADYGASATRRWYWRAVPGFALRIRWSTLTGGPLAAPSIVLPSPHATRREPMRTLVTDAKYAARAMARSPAFTAIAILTLALGIGANATIFSVVRAVLLRPLPFPEPHRIVELQETHEGRGTSSFAHANFWDVHDLNRSLEAVGSFAGASMNLTGTTEPRRLSVGYVTVGFFRTLGVQPAVGRLFTEGEDQPGADPRLVVLSHAFWQSRGASAGALGSATITLDDQPYRVIGVLPQGTPWLDAADVFVPLVRRPGYNRESWELPVIARLRPGVSLTAAQADLDAVARRIAESDAKVRDLGIVVGTTEDWVASPAVRRALWVLLAAVGFLMLIACVNLGNMLLARATARLRERAMRSALGASRGRVMQLATVESLLLGGVGSALGVALAYGALRALRLLNPGEIPRLGDARIDGWVLLVAVGAGLLTSVLAGLVPSMRLPLGDLASALRDGERSVAGSRGAGRLRRALVTLEVALSLMLLVGAGLLIRSFDNVLGVEHGFRTEDRVMLEIGFPSASTDADNARRAGEMSDVLARIRALPQVTSAAVVHQRPLRGAGTGMGFGAVDRPDATGTDIPWAGWRLVSSDYFKALGVPLLAGRDFTERDQLGAQPYPVIISQRIAELLWPGESAIGRPLELWKGQTSSRGEVIGVAGDMRDWALTEDPTYSVYLPIHGYGRSLVYAVVHGGGPTAALVSGIRSAVAGVNPALPVGGVQRLDEIVADSVASRRFTMLLLATLAGLALLLAVGGTYGVLAYTVSQRRAEVGVRLALGASSRSVLRLVMLQGLAPVMVGIVIGVAGAFALSRSMSTLLFGLTPADPPTYLTVAALLMATAALSCYLPARDAMRVDVLQALREE